MMSGHIQVIVRDTTYNLIVYYQVTMHQSIDLRTEPAGSSPHTQSKRVRRLAESDRLNRIGNGVYGANCQELKQQLRRSAINSQTAQRVMDSVEALILEGEYLKALQILEDWMDRLHAWLPQAKFVAAGNVQNWHGLCPGGAKQWFSHTKERGWLRRNPNDYASFCLGALADKGAFQTKYVKWYQRQLRARGPHFELLVGLGNLYYNNNQWLEAEGCYLEAIKVNPSHDKVWEYLAWIYGFHYENDSMGKKHASQALQINPHNFYAHLLVACCHQSFSQIVEELKIVIQLEPYYYLPYVLFAYYKPQHKMTPKYLDFCEKLDPNYPYYLIVRMEVAFKEKYFETAKSYYRKCIRLHPNFARSHYNYASMTDKFVGSQKAELILIACTDSNPQFFQAFRCLARIYEKRGDMTKAIEYHEKAINVNPYSSKCLGDLANLYQKQKSKEKVKQCYLKVRKFDPLNFKNVQNLIQCCSQLGHFDQAVKYSQEASVQFPYQFIESHYCTLAKLYLSKLKDLQQALLTVNKSLQRGAKSTSIFTLKGKILSKMGRNKAAFVWCMYGVEFSQEIQAGRFHQQLFKPMTQTEMKFLVTECYQNGKWSSVTALLQFGALFHDLNAYTLALESFQRARKQAEEDPKTNTTQKRSVQQIFGTNMQWVRKKLKGRGCIIDEIRQKSLMGRFDLCFQNIFSNFLREDTSTNNKE